MICNKCKRKGADTKAIFTEKESPPKEVYVHKGHFKEKDNQYEIIK